MQYYMPTRIIGGEDCVKNSCIEFSKLGKKALIVTGKNSSKINGSLDDVIFALNRCNIEYTIYDNVEENPSVETVVEAAEIGKKEGADFVIGIGGGSPLDASKAIALLLNNREVDHTVLFNPVNIKPTPVIAVPTTAGTGSEVTPYAILTDHSIKNKRNFSYRVFPDIAFLDAKYLENVRYDILVNTAIDALSHMIESYLSVKSDSSSELVVEKGLNLWGECKDSLLNKEINREVLTKLLHASTLAGIAIAQTGTSIPHGMSYSLTYNHNVAHGKAVGVFLPEYMSIHKDVDKVNQIVRLLGYDNLDGFRKDIRLFLGEVSISNEEMQQYLDEMLLNEAKLANHPFKVTQEELEEIYNKSLVI